jgi:hypothetical protein
VGGWEGLRIAAVERVEGEAIGDTEERRPGFASLTLAVTLAVA